MARLDEIKGAQRLIGSTYRRLRDIALWRAWSPLIILLSIFLIAALAGVFEAAPKRIGALASLIVFVGLVIGTVRGWRRYKSPTRDEAIAELDAQDELRPITSLLDRPSRPRSQSMELWNAHQIRLEDSVRRLQVPRLLGKWKRLDPLYLRFILPLALIGLIFLNGAATHSRLKSALSPDIGSLMGAEDVRVEAWVTPPSYTARAPIFLKSDQQEIRVPRGSTLTIRVQARSAPKIRVETESSRVQSTFPATPDGAYEANAEIMGDSNVSVHWWGERQSWRFLASADNPPEARFVSVPGLGEDDRTEFVWFVRDDFGVDSLVLQVMPMGVAGGPDYVAVDLGTASPQEAQESASLDLTRNRWAGSRVQVRLIATDGSGQTGYSEPHVLVLPDKLLLQPMAKAIQDIRLTLLREDRPYTDLPEGDDALAAGGLYLSATQRLQGAPQGIQRGATMLEAITYDAPRYFEDVLIFAGLSTAKYAIEAADTTEEIKSLEPLLWGLALRAEYGSAADAYAALMAAKKALEDALRDGASEEEIKRLMQAFKEAAQRYVAAKMAEALANGLDAPPDTRDSNEGPNGPGLGGQSFSDMLDALEDLTETGASDQARQLLSDITNMLENLEFQQGQNGSGEGFPGMPGQEGDSNSDEDIPQEERELSETMRELSELLRQQRELNDETLAQQRGERRQESGSEAGQGEQQGQDGNSSEEDGDDPRGADSQRGSSLVERQNELGEQVDELARRQAETGDEGATGLLDDETLEAIERAQRRAGDALRDGNESRAIRNQEQATRQLRELAEGLADRLDERRAARLGEGSRQAGGDAIDPFGNSTTGAVDDSNSVDIPDQLERQRARDILDELRRRYGDAVDEEEREYLERLLDRF